MLHVSQGLDESRRLVSLFEVELDIHTPQNQQSSPSRILAPAASAEILGTLKFRSTDFSRIILMVDTTGSSF